MWRKAAASELKLLLRKEAQKQVGVIVEEGNDIRVNVIVEEGSGKQYMLPSPTAVCDTVEQPAVKEHPGERSQYSLLRSLYLPGRPEKLRRRSPSWKRG